MNSNGNNDGNGALALSVMFKDRNLTFRHMPDARCGELRWQALREAVDSLTMPDGSVTLLQRLELVAWASTRDALISQLA